MLQLEVTENIKYKGMTIHQGTIMEIHQITGSRMVTCDGFVTGVPEGGQPVLDVEDLSSDEFEGKFRVINNKTALSARAKVLWKNIKDRIYGQQPTNKDS